LAKSKTAKEAFPIANIRLYSI